MLATIVDILIWPFYKLLGLIFLIPICVKSLFLRRKTVPPITNDILLIPATELVQKFVNKQLKCVDVIKAYKQRIEEVNPLLNAVIQDRFSEALQDAENTDLLIATTSLSPEDLLKQFPLLGVPVTVKESIFVAGMSSTGGLVKAAGNKAPYNADVVISVKNAGAIIIALTNTPELCLNFESYNPLFGATNNPYDIRRTSGGSSGGEAALLGSAGSIIGLGSDIAGSLRIPASFCGVASHKPSPKIISVKGHNPTGLDEEAWLKYFVVGPMTRYVSDLMPLFNVLVKPEYKEVLKLNENVDLKRIKIYYMTHTGNVLNNRVDGELKTLIKNVARRFEQEHGTKVEKLNFKMFKKTFLLAVCAMTSIEVDMNLYNDDKHHNAFWDFIKYVLCLSKTSLSSHLFFMLTSFMQKIISKERFEYFMTRNEQVRKDLEAILGENSVLIFPTYPDAAAYHGACKANVIELAYCIPMNSLGLPATSCPIGVKSNGMPLGIQVIASQNCDRVSLAVAKEIERMIGGWKPVQYIETKSSFKK